MSFSHKLRHFVIKKKEILYVVLIALTSLYSIPIGFQLKNRDEPTILGVSFSKKYAEELGNDWQDNYLALLDEIGVKHFRLMSYWDSGEPANDEFMLEDLDWQIDQALAHEATVSLALGQRQPRWPECHIPAWAEDLGTEQYREELLEYITTVVERYKNNPAVTSYQVENEAANSMFGECPEYDPDFLTEEIKLVKRLDPDAEVITNVSNQSGTPLRGPVQEADKVGFSIYKKAHFDAFGKNYSWSFWYVPTQWHSFRAAIVEGTTNNSTFVHELQAEPWGPEATVNLSLEEQNKTMDAKQLKNVVEFAEATGMKEIYLWGGEWWYWRLDSFYDKELWNAAKEIYSLRD